MPAGNPVSPGEVSGHVVLGWRASEEGLFLRFRDRPGEVRLQSACGRCHWLVHEHLGPEGPQLLVTCHACREHYAFALEQVAG